MEFPVLFPEKPKAPLKWPARLPLMAAAIVGAWAIATYVLIPWISRPDTMTTFEDRLVIHSHRAISTYSVSNNIVRYVETTPKAVSTAPPASSIPTPAALAVSTKPATRPKPFMTIATRKRPSVNPGHYYMFLPPFLHGVPDTDAPFYRWKQNGEFHSAANCEKFRQQAIGDTANDRDQDPSAFKSLYDNRIKLLTAASCVSQHDARMKEVD